MGIGYVGDYGPRTARYVLIFVFLCMSGFEGLQKIFKSTGLFVQGKTFLTSVDNMQTVN